MINFSFSAYDLEYFLLIVMRVSSFVFISPFFGQRGVPNRVKAVIAVITSALLYQTLTPAPAIVYDTVLEYAIIVMKEVIAGLLLGFGGFMCTTVLQLAGAIADMETGLSMVQALDPATNQQISITGALYNYGFMLMLIATGMYRYMFGALADSFKLIPVNGMVIDSGALLTSTISFLTDYVLIGFRIILPIFCSMILLNAVLGVMAKVSPQMNMFAIGMQLKVLTGLSVLFLSIGMLESMSDMLFEEIKIVTVNFVTAMGGAVG